MVAMGCLDSLQYSTYILGYATKYSGCNFRPPKHRAEPELQWETLKTLYHCTYRMWYAQVRHFLDADIPLAHRVDRPDYEDQLKFPKNWWSLVKQLTWTDTLSINQWPVFKGTDIWEQGFQKMLLFLKQDYKYGTLVNGRVGCVAGGEKRGRTRKHIKFYIPQITELGPWQFLNGVCIPAVQSLQTWSLRCLPPCVWKKQ